MTFEKGDKVLVKDKNGHYAKPTDNEFSYAIVQREMGECEKHGCKQYYLKYYNNEGKCLTKDQWFADEKEMTLIEPEKNPKEAKTKEIKVEWNKIVSKPK